MNHHESVVLEASLHSLFFCISWAQNDFLDFLVHEDTQFGAKRSLGFGPETWHHFDKKMAKVLAKGAWIIPGCSWSKPAARASSLGLESYQRVVNRWWHAASWRIMNHLSSKGKITSRLIKIHEALLIYKFSTHSTIHPTIHPSPPSMPSMHFPHLPIRSGECMANQSDITKPWNPMMPRRSSGSHVFYQ